MKNYIIKPFPKSRIATFDMFAVARSKNHVPVFIECDVTNAINKLKKFEDVSFTAWLIKLFSECINEHKEVGAYRFRKRKLIIFNDVNFTVLVEKEFQKTKVPIPLVIKKTNKKTIREIYLEIHNAKQETFKKDSVVLQRKSKRSELLYYRLPAFLRRLIWKILLKKPIKSYEMMGNALLTSVGMHGNLSAWFLTKSIHPISFGISSITKKPAVWMNEIKIRDILNFTVLIDHDAVDGVPAAKFINHVAHCVENAKYLDNLNI
jgi:pyruvate/2-oxoglutarate dehydrogenase complex dihydrolipoamide acyltransferase (E2) component